MTELPEGWSEVQLSEITQVNPSLDRCPFPETGDVHFVPMPAVEAETGKIDVSATRPYPEVRKGYTAFVPGDVLFAKITPCMENGKMAVVPDLPLSVACGSTEFHVLRPHSGIVAEYVYYFVSSKAFRYEAEHNMTGAVGQKRVPKGFVADHSIPLPPTNEQHRIVAKLEALFSELDAGQDSLTRAQAQLKLYRQSLLKAAFQGRLTADWRKANPDKLEPPETLLARIRSERDARYKQALDDWQTALTEWRAGGEVGRKPAKPKRPADPKPLENNGNTDVVGWVTLPLGGLAYRADLGKMLDKAKNKGTPRPYFGNINLRWGAFNIDAGKTIPIEDHEVERYGICAGDLVICEGGEPGRCAVWTGEDNRYFIQKALHRVRFTDSYLPFFAYYFMIYAAQSGILDGFFTGSTIKHLTGSALAEVPFPLCSILEQQEIISILEERLSSIDAIETEITTALAKLSALRQSILKKAFSGQLVPQDPADEPAAALLSRLRAAAPKEKPRRKVRA